MSDELGPYVEPVQLQVVCRQLWATLPADATAIETGDVAAVGNVDDALAEFYVSSIKAVAASTGVTERALRAWFDERLITEQGFRAQVHEGPGTAGPRSCASSRTPTSSEPTAGVAPTGTSWPTTASSRPSGPATRHGRRST